MLKDRDEAQDVLQETYLRVLVHENAGERLREPRALLYRTARNIMLDRHRRAEVRAQVMADEEPSDDLADDPAGRPDRIVAARQAAQAMAATIEALPPRCREAFVLFKFDGLGQAEIAARMGISANMVAKHIMRAMDACERCRDEPERVKDPAAPASGPPRAA